MIVDGSAQSKSIDANYDAVVIGSGAGGAVIAKELAQGGLKVAILEEGAHHRTSSHTDLAFESISRLYRNRGFTTTIGTPAIAIPLGRALGGTTVINSGTCFRTPERILQHWREELGLTQLDPKEFNLIFERIERQLNVQDSEFRVMSRANTLIHELLEKKGIKGAPLKRNVKNCDGCGFCCYGCPTGAKQSMEQSYLPQAFLYGATAYTNCTATQLLLHEKRVQGVIAQCHDGNGKPTRNRVRIHAPITIVACGTILTPQFLRDNGVAISNRNLGRNLTIHPATKVFAQFKESINGWEGTPQAYYSDVLEKEGIKFEGIFVPPDVAAMTAPFIGRRLNEFMRNYKHMAAFGFLIEDASYGRVMKLPFLGTSVLYNMTREDVEKMRKGVHFLATLFLEGGADSVYTTIHGHNEIRTSEDLDRLQNSKIRASDIECMAFHPLGTCRMGVNETAGVVDSNHKVFGWEGIYVCDGSVIPTSLGVNPQISIMAFATRLANALLAGKSASRLAQG